MQPVVGVSRAICLLDGSCGGLRLGLVPNPRPATSRPSIYYPDNLRRPRWTAGGGCNSLSLLQNYPPDPIDGRGDIGLLNDANPDTGCRLRAVTALTDERRVDRALGSRHSRGHAVPSRGAGVLPPLLCPSTGGDRAVERLYTPKFPAYTTLNRLRGVINLMGQVITTDNPAIAAPAAVRSPLEVSNDFLRDDRNEFRGRGICLSRCSGAVEGLVEGLGSCFSVATLLPDLDRGRCGAYSSEKRSR
jgi:hypothetical protein